MGGNLGNRLQILDEALALINKKCGVIVKISKIYETEAWGSDSENKFLNRVVVIETKFSAQQLIEKLLAIEKNLEEKGPVKKMVTEHLTLIFYFLMKM